MSEVRGDERVVAHLGALSAGLRERMLRTMNAVGIDVQTYVVTQKLSGQVLNRRSGALSASINQKVRDDGQTITAVIGSNLKKGGYNVLHEYGAYNAVVPLHERMQTMAWGKRMKNPRLVFVNAHVAHYPVRSYLRSSLRETAPRELERIELDISLYLRGAA